MKIRYQDLEWAVGQRIISNDQARLLWRRWDERRLGGMQLDLLKLALYTGMLLVLTAQGWLLFSAWEEFGGWGVAFLGFLYMLLFTLVGRLFWNRKTKNIPGGLMVILAAAMVPVIGYGLERALDWWPVADPAYYQNIRVYLQQGGWFPLELAGIIACLLFTRWFSFPLLTVPAILCLWRMAIELTPMLLPAEDMAELSKWVTLYVGLGLISVSFVLDYLTRGRKKTCVDYAFWSYCLGAAAVWVTVTMFHGNGVLDRLSYALLNMVFLLLAMLLQRGIFAVFAFFGLAGYWGFHAYLAYGNSALFAVILGAIGLSLLFLGVIYQYVHERWQQKIHRLIPKFLSCYIPNASSPAAHERKG